MRFHERKIELISLTALVWAAAIGFAFAAQYRLAAKSPTQIALTTSPASVRITINGKKQADGSYILTPTTLLLAAGRHKMTISRDGYYAQTSEIEDSTGRKIEMANVVLQPVTDQRFVSVEIEGPEGEAPLNVEIDDGFAVGPTPLILDDLLADKAHILAIHSSASEPPTPPAAEALTPPTAPPFRCRFAVPASEGSAAPYKISIKRNGTSYRATGCVKLRPKK